jgi:saccharopine dehydrogenase-like NADP-dependent oxidoreductase
MIELSNVLAGQTKGHWKAVNFNLVTKPDKKKSEASSRTTDAPSTISGLFILANEKEKIDFIQFQELDSSKATVESFTTTEKRIF